MVSKRICQACINGDNTNQSISLFNDDDETNFSWGAQDEEAWKKGAVCCPLVSQDDETVPLGLPINGNPPRDCPFQLEHLLDVQE